MHPSSAPASQRPWWLTAAVMLAGCFMAASVCRTWLADRHWSQSFLSPPSWSAFVTGLTGHPPQTEQVDLPFAPFLGAAVAVALVAWLGGAARIARVTAALPSDRSAAFRVALKAWGVKGWSWWCALGAWEWVWTMAAASGWEGIAGLLVGSIPFWTAVCLGGWLTTGHVMASCQPACTSSPSLNPQPSTLNRLLWLLVGTYVAVFVTLNWRLWFNLFIPHGDSAMYEEHLWNVLHGKGFRSYLDQGLFLGEHVQVVHLGLLPLYLLWPSHLLLELCESAALALGAFPVAWMTARRCGGADERGSEGGRRTIESLATPELRYSRTPTPAVCAAAAYLLYFPMQFLDIEIDLKTFRPEAFGIPILLLTLDQLDRRNWKGFLLGVLGCLTVKEDYALVLGPLGLWIALCDRDQSPSVGSSPSLNPRPSTLNLPIGLGLAVFSIAYLWLATRVVMPWFRPGEEIHYARYFSRLGETPEAIVRTILTRPGFVAGELLTVQTWLYALCLLVPVAGLALLSPTRLAVGLPLFGVLCLNEIARDPRHQFHAPLVAIVFWAAAAGLGRIAEGRAEGLKLRATGQRKQQKASVTSSPSLSLQPSALGLLPAASHALWIFAFTTGIFFSLSPLGLAFWDPGSNWHWRKLYGPTQRGTQFAKVLPQIPITARVASTDFVHPRFTHHERSYDYSGYARKVSGYEHRVPDDTDYIVIDTTHPYSRHHHPEDVPEFHQPEWELLPDVTEGYYIILKRRLE